MVRQVCLLLLLSACESYVPARADSSNGGAGTGPVSPAGGSPASSGAAGSGGAGAGSAAGAAGVVTTIDDSPADAPGAGVSYVASDEVVLNPERGFYARANLTAAGDLSGVRASGKTLVYADANIDSYLGDDHAQDLPQAFVDDVQAGFDAIRDAGLKAVVRFQYDDGEGYPDGANDAPESFILRHIEQLAPVLAGNRDVLFVLQAGFIGAWGEWHTSLNFGDGFVDKDARQRIVEALLLAAPGVRVGVRYPAYKRMFQGESATTAGDLVASAPIAHLGHINDCFVSSADDGGTYQYEPAATLRAYLEDDTAYTPIGGESCAEDQRNACDVSIAEMERFHWTYINDEYHPAVLERWASEGCRDEMERRLGYRLLLQDATLPAAVKPGGTFVLRLTVSNEGFAAPSSPRPVFVVLEGQGERWTVELPWDPRLWLPGAHLVAARLRLPAALTPGSYRLALWLPDAAEGLRERAEYSLRLANQELWQDSSADHTLATLDVSTDAAGDADPAAGDALEIIEPEP
jgi:hypothetical protein